SAAAVGVVLAYMAVQTGSLWPGVLFHAVHNSLQLSIHRILMDADAVRTAGGVQALVLGVVEGENAMLYRTPVVLACGGAAAAILWSWHYLSYSRTKEEALQEARERRASQLAGA
ncbi:MAG: CPBP family intramembrane metalloprotease, partial [Planctomycetales bacterium]|nr:CPBP family intramembrane metalloprotease [Planctomycetales bacterium]